MNHIYRICMVLSSQIWSLNSFIQLLWFLEGMWIRENDDFLFLLEDKQTICIWWKLWERTTQILKLHELHIPRIFITVHTQTCCWDPVSQKWWWETTRTLRGVLTPPTCRVVTLAEVARVLTCEAVLVTSQYKKHHVIFLNSQLERCTLVMQVSSFKYILIVHDVCSSEDLK